MAYLATQRWAARILTVTHNNTRMLRKEVGSLYGLTDSAMFNFRGAHGYVVQPNYVFPDNTQHGSQIGPNKKQVELKVDRDHLAVQDSLESIKRSARHWNEIRPIAFKPTKFDTEPK